MTSQDVDNYKQIKSDLDQLRSNVEKSELWVYKRQGDEGMDAGDGPPSESDHKKKVAAFIIESQRPTITYYEWWLAYSIVYRTICINMLYDVYIASLLPFYSLFFVSVVQLSWIFNKKLCWLHILYQSKKKKMKWVILPFFL